MRTEEWQKGMENEAASVEDAGWARETRLASRQFRRSPLWNALLPAALIILDGYLYIVLMASYLRYTLRLDANPIGAWLAEDPGRLWGFLEASLTFVPLVCGFVLGLMRASGRTVAVTFLFTPLLLALTTLLYQAARPVIYQSAEGPVTVNLVGYALNPVTIGLAGISALLAWFGSWAGNRLSKRWSKL